MSTTTDMATANFYARGGADKSKRACPAYPVWGRGEGLALKDNNCKDPEQFDASKSYGWRHNPRAVGREAARAIFVSATSQGMSCFHRLDARIL